MDEGGVRSPMFIKWPEQIEAGLKVERSKFMVADAGSRRLA